MTQHKRWLAWLVAALVVALLVLGVGRAVSKRQAQAQASAAAPAAAPALLIAPQEVWTVRRHPMVLGVPVSGTLLAVQSATIKARVAGELQGLDLREGDSVRQGDVVARIDATEMQARLRQAQQQADAAGAQVAINQRQFDNNRALVAQGFISRTALETSQASLQAARASHAAAQAGAEVARNALSDTVLRSPLSGQVAQRLVQNGERVGIETRILEVVDLSQLEVQALMAPADAVQVRIGQVAQLRIEGSSETLRATVARINPSAQAGSRSVPVYLAVDNRQALPALRQGLFVQGTLQTGSADLLTVPLESVRIDKPAPYVQLADTSTTPARVVHRDVRTGARSVVDGQALVAIEGDVPEGSLVLSGRVGPLPEGAALQLPAAPAPALPLPRPEPHPPCGLPKSA